jgi:predicted acylesterase/phospholipase RssA
MANIGLVLSGGMAKGAYQVGVLKALREFVDLQKNDRIYISSSSIGALNAYAYLSGRLKHFEKLWLNMELPGGRAPRSTVRIFAKTPYIANFVDALIGAETAEITQDFYMTCFNPAKRKLKYVNLREVPRADVRAYLKAGVAMPLFAKSVEIGGQKYTDGALIDNIPILPLMKHRLDYIIVVYFDKNSYAFENEYFDNKLVKINFLDDGVIKNSLAFDRESVSTMLAQGYKQSKEVFEILLSNGTDDFEHIHKRIAFINGLQGETQLRITGDIVVNNINKLLRQLVHVKN